MTEAEYIIAADSRAVLDAISCLRHIQPTNNPHIDADVYERIVAQLSMWHEAMLDGIIDQGFDHA